MALTRPNRSTASPDAGTLADASGGDAAAVETFVRWAWPNAHRVGYLLTHDGAASEDIAQEAVIAAVKSLRAFDSERDPRPWLERIAGNKAIDHLRQQQRRPEAEIVSGEIPDDTQLIEDLTAAVDTAISSEVMTAFGALTVEQRHAVVLRHLLDYRPAEIAEMLGIPAPTVRTHVHRGLERLREQLQQDERSSA